MPFKKGQSGNPDGRKEGTPNKLTTTIKQVFTEVFHKLQTKPEQEYALLKWATKNPTEFYKLCSRLIPTEITGKDGKELTLNIILKDERIKEEFEEAIKIA